VFRWFNLYLKNQDPLIDMAAVKMFSPAELKVLDKIPDDQINTAIQDSFVPAAQTPQIPATADAWHAMQQTWTNELRTKCFAGWPANPGPLQMKQIVSETNGGICYEKWEFPSQPNVILPVYSIRKESAGTPLELILVVAGSSLTNDLPDEPGNWTPGIQQVRSAFGSQKRADGMAWYVSHRNALVALFFPRGIGPAAVSGGSNQLVHLRRRLMLLGQTLDGMQVWDICRAAEGLHSLPGLNGTPLHLESEADMGVNSLYASLFSSAIDSLRLTQIPASQRDGPDYLNVLKVLDIPEAAAMAAGRCRLQLQSDQSEGWEFLRSMAASPAASLKLEWLK
jgi:hypothetical protein